MRKKRLRQKVKNRHLRRKISRMVLKSSMILIFIIPLFLGYKSLLRYTTSSEKLTIKSLVVLGDYPDREEIEEEVERYCLKKFRCKRPNILKLKLDDLRRHLESLPKVSKVRIRRRFPETIFIEVERRIPIAFILNGSSILGCDQEKVFEIEVPSNYDLPFITGLTRMEEIKQAIKVILEMRDTNPELLSMISEINVSDPKNLFAYTIEKTRILFGDVDRYDLKEKLARLKAVLDYAKEAQLQPAYIDLRFDRIAVKPGDPGGYS